MGMTFREFFKRLTRNEGNPAIQQPASDIISSMNVGRPSIVVALSLAMVLPVMPSGAHSSPGQEDSRTKAARQLLQRYNEELASIYEDLQENTRRSNRRALRGCEDLRMAFTERLLGNDISAKFFGYTLFFESIAEFRLGRLDNAVWDWQVAQSILPELTAKSYRNFSDAEDFLVDNRLPATIGDSLTPGGENNHAPCTGRSSLKPLKPIRRIMPEFPPGAALTGFKGTVVVEVVVGTDGVPRTPRLIESSGVTTADAVALLALRDWRFRPARCGDEPIESTYRLAVEYSQRPGRVH